jgi:N-acetylglucosamine-6-phosphate deacetylase
MVERVAVPLHEAVQMATQNPARALGLEGKKGSLGIGVDADLVVMSRELGVRQTFSCGKEIFRAKG